MIRTQNLLKLAAFAAIAALCTPNFAAASPLHAAPTFSGGYNGGNNGCNGGNNGGHHDGDDDDNDGHGCHGGNGGHHGGDDDDCHGGNHGGGGHHGGGNGGCGGNGGNLDCDAGGPYVVECQPGPLSVLLDATDSVGATTYHWSTNYAGATFLDADAAQTTLTFTANANCCPSQLYVTLTVGDGTRTRTCSTTVRVRDTQPPVIVCPPLAKVICGMDESPASTGYPDVTDNCDTNVQLTYCDRIVFQDCRAERLDHSVERTWRARDNCGNVATCLQIIHAVKVVVPIDALPGQCPNTVAFNDCSPVRFAILGTEAFNVNNVRWNTLKLYGEHCDGGPVLPLCVYPADVGTPFYGDQTNCECTDANGDGRLDLVVTFRRSQVVQNLGLCNLPSGSNKRVVLVGKLCDGCSFIGTDCVRVP